MRFRRTSNTHACQGAYCLKTQGEATTVDLIAYAVARH
jgi:hypothetical protein